MDDDGISTLADSIIEQIRERFQEETTEAADDFSMEIPISVKFSFTSSDGEDIFADDNETEPHELPQAEEADAAESAPQAAAGQHGSKDPMEELESLIGLQNVKDQVRSLANLVHVRQLRKKKGMPLADMAQHMIFTGNPGMGKTTVARIVAQIYARFGFLSKGHLTEVDQSELIGGYIVQTAAQVKNRLFTDSLGNQHRSMLQRKRRTTQRTQKGLAITPSTVDIETT